MASTTKNTFLKDGGVASGAASWTADPPVAIKDYSVLDGAPNMVDITTLSDEVARQIPGVKSADAWKFKANYDKTQYTALKALEGVEHHFAVWFGTAGADGKIACTGYLTVSLLGGSVDDAREMEINIARTSVPVLS